MLFRSTEYFYAYTMKGVNTFHIRPEFMGQDLLEKIKDGQGRYVIKDLLAALQGRFVPPGPSGAPSRGRLDVLPTGRNFYSVDVRHLPTPTAWRIGVQSAERLLERHLQDEGEHLQRLGLSVWGTATMRTGGDDIAQALALLGVRPVWQPGSQRVERIEVLPLEQLGRPRVDVTLRVSGFFRNAFAFVPVLLLFLGGHHFLCPFSTRMRLILVIQ